MVGRLVDRRPLEPTAGSDSTFRGLRRGFFCVFDELPDDLLFEAALLLVFALGFVPDFGSLGMLRV